MSATVLSIDIGIRNLAYCVMSKSTNYQILKWGTIDCCPPSAVPDKCYCCASKAILFLADEHDAFPPSKKYSSPVPDMAVMCMKHANQVRAYSKQQVKSYTLTTLKNMYSSADQTEWNRVCAMVAWNKSFGEQSDSPVATRPRVPTDGQSAKAIVRHVYDQLQRRTCLPVVRPSASKVCLTDVIMNLATACRERQLFSGITDLIIENQIGPKAVRMKAIQEVITAMGIFSGIDSLHIHGVSSAHKLTDVTLVPGTKTVDELEQPNKTAVSVPVSVPGPGSVPGPVNAYKTHKSDGIVRCQDWLQYIQADQKWHKLLNDARKKDDLADSFLQAIWGLQHLKCA
jgi:hypothetical protein